MYYKNKIALENITIFSKAIKFIKNYIYGLGVSVGIDRALVAFGLGVSVGIDRALVAFGLGVSVGIDRALVAFGLGVSVGIDRALVALPVSPLAYEIALLIANVIVKTTKTDPKRLMFVFLIVFRNICVSPIKYLYEINLKFSVKI